MSCSVREVISTIAAEMPALELLSQSASRSSHLHGIDRRQGHAQLAETCLELLSVLAPELLEPLVVHASSPASFAPSDLEST